MKLHNGKKVERVVKAPTLRREEGQPPGDILLNFYKDLGWNPDTNEIDPMRIRTTEAVYNSINDAIREAFPDAHLEVGFLMVNSGPGVDSNIPHTTVILLEGWLQPISTT